VVGANQDVVSRDQVHHSQESCSGHVAGQACNHATLKVDQHRIAETFVHKRNSSVVRRYIGSLSKVGKHLNVLRQVFEWILAFSFGGAGNKKQDGQSQKESHGGHAIKPEVVLKRAPSTPRGAQSQTEWHDRYWILRHFDYF
jgi:hypothetical protein